MRNKFLVFTVIIAMILGLAACTAETEVPQESDVTTSGQVTAVTTTAKTTTTAAATTKKEETTLPVNPFAEKMTINWLVGVYSSHLYVEGRWDELELEEKFNIDLKMWNVQVDSNNMEQVKMMLAAGDVPDYGFYYTSGKYLYEQGLGRTVKLNLIKQYYPSYYKQLISEPVGLCFNKVEETEDEYYGLTSFTCMATHTGHIPMWRLDWLEELGYRMDDLTPMIPSANPEFSNNIYYSSTKFSVDDVKEILRACTEDDPDGNGVDDSYGSAYSNTWYDIYISYGMYGYDKDANHFYKDPVTGDYVPYYAYTPYKDTFIFLTEMLDKGYMKWIPGKESYANELFAIWATGKTAFMNALCGSSILGYNLQAVNRPPLSILQNEPEAKFVVTPVPGEKGKFRPYWTFNWNASYTYPIGIDVSDDKLIRILQLLEYSYFGENWMRYKFGIEGVHYKWAGEPMKSTIILTDPEKIPAKYAGKGTNVFGQFGNINFVSDNKIYFSYDAFTNQLIDFWEIHNEGGYYHDSLWIRPGKYYSEFTMPTEMYVEYKKLRDETSPQINTVHNDFTKKIWAGQVANMDTEWEHYIEQIYAAGLESWVEIWNRDDVKPYQYYNSIQ